MTVEADGQPLSPEDVVTPDWTERPLWHKKLRLWKSLVEKGCLAKKGQGGHFCGWRGVACSYNACPRRIFEEVAVTQEAIPPPKASPNFVRQLNQAMARVTALEKARNIDKKTIDQLTEELKKIKELADPSAVPSS